MIVASVPHSGSRFVQGLLPGTGLWHVYRSGESLAEILRHKLIVVPIRHPTSVAQSWKNRGKPIVRHETHEPMVTMWRTLIDVVAPRNPYYVPVDSLGRDKYLERLSDALGRTLVTDWKPVSDGHPTIPLDEDDEAAVSELLTDPFFEQFYPTCRV